MRVLEGDQIALEVLGGAPVICGEQILGSRPDASLGGGVGSTGISGLTRRCGPLLGKDAGGVLALDLVPLAGRHLCRRRSCRHRCWRAGPRRRMTVSCRGVVADPHSVAAIVDETSRIATGGPLCELRKDAGWSAADLWSGST